MCKVSIHKNAVSGLFLLIFLCVTQALTAAEWYVSPSGDDSHRGKKHAPFQTISQAAAVAKAGDTVWVADGVYRESVLLPRGGAADDKRISYRAIGKAAVITGSEPVTHWQQDEKSGLWKAILPKAFFGAFNPFARLVRPDSYVEVDETSQGWGWLMYGRRKHRGDVYFNGEGLIEKENRKALEQVGTWYVDVSPEQRYTVIWANFGANNPNDHEVEVNVRPYGFMAEKIGLGYITIDGFTVKNMATHWAPPTTFQLGAITANGGHHWHITNNNVLYSKALGISIGQPADTQRTPTAESGHHVVANNIILRCGQGGIAGLEWGSHSTIQSNVIEETNYRKEFGGWETAAIKFHVLTDVVIADNFIRGVSTQSPGAAHGIWIDYQNTHIHLSNNIIIDAQEDAMLFEANWEGPFLVENNILINGKANTMSSQDEVWAHNLLVNVNGHWLDQDYGDRPVVQNGRWFNNVLFNSSLAEAPEGRGYRLAHNVYLQQSQTSTFDEDALVLSQVASVNYTLNDKQMVLHLDLPAEVTTKVIPWVTSDYAKQPLVRRNGETVVVDHDNNGEQRVGEFPVVGPLAKAKEGKHDTIVYEFPDRYAQVKAMIGNGW